LHRVLRHRLRERLSGSEGKATLVDSICGLAESRGSASHTWFEDPSVRAELNPLSALARELAELERNDTAVSLGNRITTPMAEMGRFAEQRAVLEPLVSESNLILLAPTEASALLSNFAMILQHMGELPQARKRIERAIEILERNFDPNHHSLATSYSNLATILRAMGDLPQARERMERAIKIDERNFDPNHPTLATSYSNLALIRFQQGDRSVACALLNRAEEIVAKHFSPDHPTYRTILANIALACGPED
jgi:tetratricopeptide (TPR) repeat protein